MTRDDPAEPGAVGHEGVGPGTRGDPLREFLDVMRRLRAECSWKAAQDHRSLVRYLLEEAHETVEAIETGTPDDLREELGDLLLQVFFHAVVAEQAGEFTLDDVARDVTAKMHRRNPHVFGDAPGGTPAEVDAAWQRIKAAEKAHRAPTEGIPASLPALLYADKVLGRLAQAGVVPDAPATGGIPATGGPDRPDRPDRVLGERLLALVADAREAGVDPEQALRDAVRRRAPG